MKTELGSEEIASDYDKLLALHKEIEERETELSILYSDWEELCLNRDRLEKAEEK